jgi:phosphate/sulfate permease
VGVLGSIVNSMVEVIFDIWELLHVVITSLIISDYVGELFPYYIFQSIRNCIIKIQN